MASMNARKPYPSDVTDTEWEFAAPYLTLLSLHAGQHDHPLREAFRAVFMSVQGPRSSQKGCSRGDHSPARRDNQVPMATTSSAPAAALA